MFQFRLYTPSHSICHMDLPGYYALLFTSAHSHLILIQGTYKYNPFRSIPLISSNPIETEIQSIVSSLNETSEFG